MNQHNENSKILILGGNPETSAIVEVANNMGLKTFVIDPYSKSPAKRHAYKSFDIDVTDLDKVDKIIKEFEIQGILVGVADPLVPYYQKLCEKWGFHCYATSKIIYSLSSKSNFAKTCHAYGVNVIPNYTIDSKNEQEIKSLQFPVVVKPVDSGAGVGITICNNYNEAKLGIVKALKFSLQKNFIIEKFMVCDDMFAYYTFVNGKAYISALADRHKTKKQANFSSVCLAAEYPSKYKSRFLTEVHPLLLKMFTDLNIKNGVLLIQFFVDEFGFYAYDPGFRLQGEAPHLYLKHFNHFDQREMLLDFAMSGSMYKGDFSSYNDYNFNGNFATTIWIILIVGRIEKISGLDSIKNHPNVIDIIQRFVVGDNVYEEMIGTERQVFARIYTVAKSKKEKSENIEFIYNKLTILNDRGENMILDTYTAKEDDE